MVVKELRPHQREAVYAVLRALELPARSTVRERGLRTQVIMATGSGKTLVAVRSAEELQAGRVLVLVPSLDLLAQTEAAWREGGRTGPAIGVSSLRGLEASFSNTTDVDELLTWVRQLDKVTVFATYASLGLGTLERAHAAPRRGGPADAQPDTTPPQSPEPPPHPPQHPFLILLQLAWKSGQQRGCQQPDHAPAGR
ncbi:DEAD/DEAH box helicase family protein [Streptomyces sp. NPDC004561]